ncbi:sigma-70 family RNA polymerase sigma factor [Bacteroides stercorirosoris]|jgi:RNA polymerase sigma-70 factor (family 1)|uniref:sigma-70 family RNA polymerase sigma factor n=1 Tax=Bacteroides stercorirosoris TaxID=871324 RepID=UPI000968934D|nr:sigma-70 family RNA polymerase sigma factor [Bacteroides stercorirosoris]OKZ13907.1 MAG: RNA polymerase subunit sigma-70 [Bacteroides oleiciplenus]
MEDLKATTPCLISDSYKEYYSSVCSYINYRINNWETARDLSQDVFLRLMDYKQMLRPDTVKYFIFTIARNLLNDYLRRYYKKQEITSYIYDHSITYTNETESLIIAKELSLLEKHKLEMLSDQRRKIYTMNRFEDKSISEISSELSISPRTVENHLFVSRKVVRDFIRQCI